MNEKESDKIISPIGIGAPIDPAFRFNFKWLFVPCLIIFIAVFLVFFFPSPVVTTPSLVPVVDPLPVTISTLTSAQAENIIQNKCETTFSCDQTDCLETVFALIDLSTHTIDISLPSPSPPELREHLTAAVQRGVVIRLLLPASLNEKFYFPGISIHKKELTHYSTNYFLVVDSLYSMGGMSSNSFALENDTLSLICNPDDVGVYSSLFESLWETQSSSFSNEAGEGTSLSEENILSSENTPAESCIESTCGPDEFVCEGENKVWYDYFCSTACVYQTTVLYYSSDCGYENPGFDSDGNPLVILSETEVDEGTIETEFLEFTSIHSLELSNFTLLKDNETIITFPEPFILDGSAKVYTGTGTNATSTIYLGFTSPLWKTQGVSVKLVNPNGDVVATATFEG